MTYQPGTHIISTLEVPLKERLFNHSDLKFKIDELIIQFGLQKLGEVYHDFSPAGFTAVICLSESHISIHTWPEHNLINLDIYLSNFQKNNDGTVSSIYHSIKEHFKASVIKEQTIIR